MGENLPPGEHGQAPLSRARETGLRNLYEVKTLVNHVRDPIVSALGPSCSRNAD